ncbi:MAG: phosphotransferase family protein [Proteobacteria bacterium]|mgnify:FL=1|nr:phosphotransferase family protein [Pseudomonadota bacterium]MDB4827080.1 phosphotransferase family protein [Gammaproteobacteria bacterium]MBT4107896.1 phosphotransferase family protein [Pseudomonadota bacterium]MBT4358021.1 phosphotransferase family protein [Pseudomonadota bacterium]MBT5190496.1 phosphotransferase family protein [Pseudomonadota bacterium]
MNNPNVHLESIHKYLAVAAPEIDHINKIEKFSNGQSNPTYLLSTDRARYVLRSKPAGDLLKSAHAVEREYKVMKALKDTDVPVPRMLCLCENEGVAGSIFFVMSYEEGRIFWDPALPRLSASDRSILYTNKIRTLAALHSVDPSSVGLEGFGRMGNYFERQFNRWTTQYRASETQKIAEMETLIHWLTRHMPADDGQSAIIHGDFRLDNLIISTNKPCIEAIIDWELSTLGHPLADLAYFCMCLRMPSGEQISGLQNIQRSTLGIPSEDEMLSSYCSLRQIGPIDDWSFYLAFSFFRLAAICQGVLKRAIDGNASSEKALQVGALAPRLAQQGVDVIKAI